MIKIIGPYKYKKFLYKSSGAAEITWEHWYRQCLFTSRDNFYITKGTISPIFEVVGEYGPKFVANFYTLERAQEYIDSELTKQGYKFVSQEEFDKLLILK